MPHGSTSRTRRRLVAAASLIAALVLSGCVPQNTVPDATKAPATVIGDVPANLKSFYEQVVTWTKCEKDFQCASVEVPLNYADPGQGKIKLAVTRLPATGKRTGSLLINPGGPGGSGVDMVVSSGKAYFSAKIRSVYDIVGFDPRGVQRSEPIKCMDDAQMDAARQENYDINTAAGLAQAEKDSKDLAALCKANSGPNLQYVDTDSSAKDLDILRAIVGDAKLNYMGFSYGTKLGAVYAGLFPSKVGKFSLDGALDPSLDIDQVSAGQAKGFDTALRAWAANCLSTSDCPVSGTVDNALSQIRDLYAVYDKTPQQTPEHRVVTGTEFINAIAFTMYSSTLWEPLSAALKQAFAGDASGMLNLADYSNDRDSDGHYTTNISAAFTAINCLDYPMNTDITHMRTEAAALEKISPTFGPLLGYSGLSCKYWPYPAVGKTEVVHAKGAAPILVIGTTRDPATPYEWAQLMAKNLDSGVLVTWDGDGHTAYGHANACLTSAVDDYFVDGNVPANGLKC